jgi:hypothetical protein
MEAASFWTMVYTSKLLNAEKLLSLIRAKDSSLTQKINEKRTDTYCGEILW